MPEVTPPTPPTPEQQAPPRKRVYNPPNFTFAPQRGVDQTQPWRLKCLVYGRNGTGKTTAACRLPNPLVLYTQGDVSKRAVEASNPNALKQQVRTLDEFLSAMEYIVHGDVPPFDTLVIDSFDDIQQWKGQTLLKRDGRAANMARNLTMEEFGELRDWTLKILARLRDLLFHVVLITGETEITDHKSGEIKGVRPALIGGSREVIAGRMNLAVQAYKQQTTDGKTAYLMRTDGGVRYVLKGHPNIPAIAQPNLARMLEQMQQPIKAGALVGYDGQEQKWALNPNDQMFEGDSVQQPVASETQQESTPPAPAQAAPSADDLEFETQPSAESPPSPAAKPLVRPATQTPRKR